jgi:Icc-related predicted phosphoesterase
LDFNAYLIISGVFRNNSRVALCKLNYTIMEISITPTIIAPAPLTEKKPGYVRVVAISDTHGHIDQVTIPEGDILIDCGDTTYKGSKNNFNNYILKLASLPHKHKIIIAGNHDVHLDTHRKTELMKYYPHLQEFDDAETIGQISKFIYLNGNSINLFGYKIYGNPHIPNKEKHAFSMTPEQLIIEWAKIPSDTDILITHTPPQFIGDFTVKEVHGGCSTLLKEVVNRVKPLYHLFGHIHESYGRYEYHGINFMNCSCSNKKREMTNSPIVFDLPIRETSK